jgi:predicted PurR-regulated permease PerM
MNPLDTKPIEVTGENPTGSLKGAAPQQPSPERQPGMTGPEVPHEAGASERRRLNRLQATSEVIIATAVVLTICYFAKLVLVVLLVSILLAFILAPLVDLLQRIRLPRSVGALIAVLLLLAALYGMFYAGYTRAQAFAQELPRYSGEIRKIVGHVRQKTQNIQETAEGVLSSAQSKPDKRTVRVVPGPSWPNLFTSNLGPITEVTFTASFIPFLVYFMLSWQGHVRSASVMLFKMEHRNTAYVTLGLISAMIRSFIIGNVLVGLFISAVSTAVFGLIGVPYFYFIGVISGFLSLVPYLGVLLAVVPPVVAGFGLIHSTQIIIIVATVLGLHLFALNVLYPKFLGSRLQLNPLAVTLALLFWGWLWGGMGLILAIPIAGATKIIFDHVSSLRPYGAWLGH